MALLLPINAVVDIYRGFTAGQPFPGSGTHAVVRHVQGHLRPDVRQGRHGYGQPFRWTNRLYLPPGIDVRSAYNSQLNSWQPATADTVLIPDYPRPGWCTPFVVVLVQRLSRGRLGDGLVAYLDRLQPRQGPCFQGCCPEPLPATLHATILPGGCFCLDGVVVSLTYSAGPNAWSGSAVVCDNEALSITYRCGVVSCQGATLTIAFENHGTIADHPVDANCTCLPPNMVFTNMSFPEPGTECEGPIAVVVTA